MYRRIFGTGPTGIGVTVAIWFLALKIERWIGIPSISMGETFRLLLLILFVTDATFMTVWSFIALPIPVRGDKLVTTGPFRWVRHPFYAAIIWSGTGAVAIWYYSWTVIFSVILINLFWTWHIQQEERFMVEKFGDEYRRYTEETGQFFPLLRKSGDPS